jgi:hypothetical protein
LPEPEPEPDSGPEPEPEPEPEPALHRHELESELSGMTKRQLRQHAVAGGVSGRDIRRAEGSKKPKANLIKAIVTARCGFLEHRP